MSAHRSFDNRDIARIAVFAALIAALGLVGPIPVPGLPVPVTAQTLGVMLAGAVLGATRGALSVIAFEALVFVGLPLLSGGRGGPGVFVSPTAGYLVGFIAGAWAVGLITHAGSRVVWWRTLLGTIVGGIPVIYAFGIPISALVARLDLGQAAIASLAFLPGDLLKAAVATLVVQALAKAYPQAFPTPRRRARAAAAAPATTATPTAATPPTAKPADPRA